MNFFAGLFDKILYHLFRNQRFPKTKVDEHNLRKRFYHVAGSKTLYINILGWHSSFSDRYYLRTRLRKNNISCLTYQFPLGILSPDYKLTEKNFLKVKSIILKDITKYKKEFGFDKIVVVGTSLGGVLAFLVTNGNKLIDELILVVPGYDLAESLWTGIATQYLEKKFQDEKLDLDKLKKDWNKITPCNNLDKLNGKKILIFASKSDEVINFKQCEKLITEFKKRKYNFSIKFNEKLGHYLTILFADRFYGIC